MHAAGRDHDDDTDREARTMGRSTRRTRATSLALVVLLGAGLAAQDHPENVAVPAEETGSLEISLPFKPKLSIGYGILRYHEHDFDAAPGLESKYEEKVIQGMLGWEFLLGHHGFSLDIDFLHSFTGTETWTEFGTLAQEDDLKIWRLGFEVSYLGSTWDRSIPASSLDGPSRFIRFGAGIGAYYRHQQFTRDDFVLYNPPGTSDGEVNEKFDMFGGEILLELEIGPRDIIAAFARGKGGGGYVTVTNDALGSLEDDARINTFGVQGTIEAGLVSQPVSHVEVRVGYRYCRMEVFTESTVTDGLLVQLPDNTTEVQVLFLELAFPF